MDERQSDGGRGCPSLASLANNLLLRQRLHGVVCRALIRLSWAGWGRKDCPEPPPPGAWALQGSCFFPLAVSCRSVAFRMTRGSLIPKNARSNLASTSPGSPPFEGDRRRQRRRRHRHYHHDCVLLPPPPPPPSPSSSPPWRREDRASRTSTDACPHHRPKGPQNQWV